MFHSSLNINILPDIVLPRRMLFRPFQAKIDVSFGQRRFLNGNTSYEPSISKDSSDSVHRQSRGDPINPTPPLWQDMTQGQFLSGV